MWIRIVKASSDKYWYADQLGKCFDVVGEENGMYKVKKYNLRDSKKLDIAPVLKEDAEVVITKNYPETREARPWQFGKDPDEKYTRLAERSEFNTSQEIQKYEALNKESKLNTKKNSGRNLAD
ncbi:hypothetical protein BCV73_08815 [Paenibacillus sp. SSG-1]|uniref:hypothetical protein n=1 Tax=Paenibacillus sp. SSG-1 TaxID=1443669 RepID=UPI000B7CDC8A|nr:hypothetical protein [Paenibacillus sp. SSG-1]OXL83168.1 hypothetical protein BCV73_08815 [Paenibacillus sp. SSG-1]